jgi:DNA-binding HxlR family transcriptional regulator
MRLSECPVRATIDVIEGKWKPIVVNVLKPGTLRFGQLRRHVPQAARKVLTEQLRELERDQIIARKVLGQRGERVEYALTPYGRTLLPVLTRMAKRGKKHKKSGHANNGDGAASLLQAVCSKWQFVEARKSLDPETGSSPENARARPRRSAAKPRDSAEPARLAGVSTHTLLRASRACGLVPPHPVPSVPSSR